MFAFDKDVRNGALASHVFESGLDVLAVITLIELVDIGVYAEISEERLCLGTERAEGLAKDDNILRKVGIFMGHVPRPTFAFTASSTEKAVAAVARPVRPAVWAKFVNLGWNALEVPRTLRSRQERTMCDIVSWFLACVEIVERSSARQDTLTLE